MFKFTPTPLSDVRLSCYTIQYGWPPQLQPNPKTASEEYTEILQYITAPFGRVPQVQRAGSHRNREMYR